MDTAEFIRQQTRKILKEARVRKRLGRTSLAAGDALGLADSNPKKLLNKIGINTSGNQTLQSVLQSFLKNETIGEAFEKNMTVNNGAFSLYIKILDDDDDDKVSLKLKTAISPFQAPRYVKAVVKAASKEGIISVDINKLKFSLFEEDESKFYVEVSLS
jgi:hypothetical protein